MRGITFIFCIVFIALVGCSGAGNIEGGGSYAAILIVDGNEYRGFGLENKGEYTLHKKIGEVLKKIPKEKAPKEDFHSNYIAETASIFSVKENIDIVLVGNAAEDKSHSIFINSEGSSEEFSEKISKVKEKLGVNQE